MPDHKQEGPSRRISLMLVCLLLFMSQLNEGSSYTRREKKTDFGAGLQVGSGLVNYHHTCVFFQVFFISDDFFSGLREIQTRTGPAFVKQRTQFDKFPGRLIVDVQAMVNECPLRYGKVMPPDYGGGLIEGASFEINWQRTGETQTRPATLISTNMVHRPGMKWDYFLVLDAKDVPLTDALDIDIALRGGLSHAHLHGTLEGRTR